MSTDGALQPVVPPGASTSISSRARSSAADERNGDGPEAASADERTRQLECLIAFLVVAVAGLGIRLWQLSGRQPSWWGDSGDYLTSSQAPLLGLELWAGERPVAVPLVLKAVGGHDMGFVRVQLAVAALAWAALAASVALAVDPRGRRWASAAAIAGFSLVFPVAMWERSVLSESLAMSALALLLAAGIQLARSVTPLRVAAVLAALAMWLATRDTHAVVALLGAVGLGGYLLLSRHHRSDPTRRLGLTVVMLGAFVVALGANLAATHGNRYELPLRNVFAARVAPYPDRVAWFADHGMPQADQFVGPNAPPAIAEEGRAPVRWIAKDDPALGPWLAWLEQDGRRALLGWMVTHPEYVVLEPWRDPERAFNNAVGDRSFYAPIDMREVPWVTGLLLPPRWATLLLVAAATGWAIRHRRWRTPVFVVGAVAVVLSAPHGLVSWHSDAMETARHLVVPVVQFQLGALLMLIGALTRPKELLT